MMIGKGYRFKTVNQLGKKSLVWMSRSIKDDEEYFSICIRKVILVSELGDYENFRVVRKIRNIMLIENVMIFTRNTFAKVLELAIILISESDYDLKTK